MKTIQIGLIVLAVILLALVVFGITDRECRVVPVGGWSCDGTMFVAQGPIGMPDTSR